MLKRIQFSAWDSRPIDIQSCRTEESIHYEVAHLNDNDAIIMGALLKTNSSITAVYLTENNFKDDGATAIGHCLATHTSLKEVSLSWNKIGDAGATALVESSKQNTTLKKLCLNHNDISNEKKKYLRSFVEKHCPSLNLGLWGSCKDQAYEFYG